VALGADPVLLFGAILSGAVFGDNLAPVSDTTIVSAVTQDSDIGGVVASRFKYAFVAAAGAIVAYLIAGSVMAGTPIQGASNLLSDQANVLGLLHVLSMLTVVFLAIRGRHIIEAISWGLFVAVAFNILAGLAPVREMLVFYAPDNPVSQSLSVLPFVVIPDDPGLVGSVGGSIYTGAAGFFPLIVLVLLIVAGSQVMIRGGGFEAVQVFLLDRVATSVRRGELTMVLGTAMVNAMITINTAAEIAIAPYIARIGKRFNINGYRRANILDATRRRWATSSRGPVACSWATHSCASCPKPSSGSPRRWWSRPSRSGRSSSTAGCCSASSSSPRSLATGSNTPLTARARR
jgi:Na+/H+ antiporter NhaC